MFDGIVYFQTDMAFRLVAQPLKRALATRSASHAAGTPRSEQEIFAAKIGTREIVGFGYNGMPAYADRADFVMPAIRWREDTPEIKALREKERGDWRKLTKVEKKALYRSSFCQTLVELRAPTGEWKLCIGAGLIAATLAIWIAVWMRVYGNYHQRTIKRGNNPFNRTSFVRSLRAAAREFQPGKPQSPAEAHA